MFWLCFEQNDMFWFEMTLFWSTLSQKHKNQMSHCLATALYFRPSIPKMVALVSHFKPFFSLIPSPYKIKKMPHPRDLSLQPNLNNKVVPWKPWTRCKVDPTRLTQLAFPTRDGDFWPMVRIILVWIKDQDSFPINNKCPFFISYKYRWISCKKNERKIGREKEQKNQSYKHQLSSCPTNHLSPPLATTMSHH